MRIPHQHIPHSALTQPRMSKEQNTTITEQEKPARDKRKGRGIRTEGGKDQGTQTAPKLFCSQIKHDCQSAVVLQAGFTNTLVHHTSFRFNKKTPKPNWNE